jgi:hypothetical protein
VLSVHSQTLHSSTASSPSRAVTCLRSLIWSMTVRQRWANTHQPLPCSPAQQLHARTHILPVRLHRTLHRTESSTSLLSHLRCHLHALSYTHATMPAHINTLPVSRKPPLPPASPAFSFHTPADPCAQPATRRLGTLTRRAVRLTTSCAHRFERSGTSRTQWSLSRLSHQSNPHRTFCVGSPPASHVPK